MQPGPCSEERVWNGKDTICDKGLKKTFCWRGL